MSELIAIKYPNVDRAHQVLARLHQLQDARLIDVADARYVTKDATARIRVHPAFPSTGEHAAVDAFFGGLVGSTVGSIACTPFYGQVIGPGSGAAAAGIIGSCVGALLGAGIGASAGIISRHVRDGGIDHDFIKQVSSWLRPGTAALIALVRSATPDKVVPELSKFGGTPLGTSPSGEIATRLQATLDQGGAGRATA